VLDRGAGQIHPLAWVRGLARAAAAAGARIHEDTEVRALEPGAPHVLRTARGKVTADRVILAGNGYLGRLLPRAADHVMPINNFVAATEPLGDRAPMGAAHAVADDRFVVNYWWQSRDGRLIYGGGESYGRRFPRDIAGRVRANLARVYPQLRDVRFTHAWGGTLAVTATRLPYAAEPLPGLMTVGGYSGHGLALAAVSGRAMARRVLGDGTDFARLARLPVPRLPGGRWLGPLVTGTALLALSARDRLGL
jgi:gamma-glutamylputrescine oxidase